jgi:hypothetical protein
VDRWLAAHGKDTYGSPEGTVYAGGTPLFDERTGTRTNRLDHVYRNNPEAQAACARSDAGAPPSGKRVPEAR